MKKIIISLILVAGLAISASAQKAIIKIPCNADKTIKLWDNNKAPHSNEETKDEYRNDKGNFYNTSHAVLYLFKADKKKATGQGVIICPGGGYGTICIEREGFALAEKLADRAECLLCENAWSHVLILDALVGKQRRSQVAV